MKSALRCFRLSAFMMLYNNIYSMDLSCLLSRQNKEQNACNIWINTLMSPKWQFSFQQHRHDVVLSEEERQVLLLRSYYLAHIYSSISTDCIKRHASHCVCCNSLTCSMPPLKNYYAYPWTDFEYDIQQKESDYFPLLTYGSLMHPESSDGLMNSKCLAVGIGLRRVFNYIHPCPSNSSLGLPNLNNNLECLRLNILYTASINDCIEGVLGYVNIKDLDRLRQREVGYDLVKVPIIELEKESSKDVLKEAYVLFAPAYNSQVTFDENYKPHVNYLNLCAEGILLRNGSPARFLRETFLVDKKTTVFEWLQKQLKAMFSCRANDRE